MITHSTFEQTVLVFQWRRNRYIVERETERQRKGVQRAERLRKEKQRKKTAKTEIGNRKE
jgi:hypothetical protein